MGTDLMSPPTAQDRALALAVLGKRTPDEIHQQAASSAPRFGLRLDVDRGYSATLPGAGALYRGVEITDAAADPDTLEQRKAALAERYAMLMQPGEETELHQELAYLDVSTARRGEGEGDSDARLKVYTDLLSRYPRDVALAAARGWPKHHAERGKWWPTVAELTRMLEHAVAERRAIIQALRSPPRGPRYSGLRTRTKPVDPGFRCAAVPLERRKELAKSLDGFLAHNKAILARERAERTKFDDGTKDEQTE